MPEPTTMRNSPSGPNTGRRWRTISWVRPRWSIYPQLAKASGIVGVVRVYVTTGTDGRVIDVSRSEGPLVLKQAAEFAARQWRFQPAIVADKRFGLTGFIEFNFTL